MHYPLTRAIDELRRLNLPDVLLDEQDWAPGDEIAISVYGNQVVQSYGSGNHTPKNTHRIPQQSKAARTTQQQAS